MGDGLETVSGPIAFSNRTPVAKNLTLRNSMSALETMHSNLMSYAHCRRALATAIVTGAMGAGRTPGTRAWPFPRTPIQSQQTIINLRKPWAIGHKCRTAPQVVLTRQQQSSADSAVDYSKDCDLRVPLDAAGTATCGGGLKLGVHVNTDYVYDVQRKAWPWRGAPMLAHAVHHSFMGVLITPAQGSKHEDVDTWIRGLSDRDLLQNYCTEVPEGSSLLTPFGYTCIIIGLPQPTAATDTPTKKKTKAEKPAHTRGVVACSLAFRDAGQLQAPELKSLVLFQWSAAGQAISPSFQSAEATKDPKRVWCKAV